MSGLHDRRAVVTGGASGIGAAIAAALLHRGATVTVVDVQADTVEGACPTPDPSRPPRCIRADVSDEDAVRALVDETSKAGPIDLLFNVAGIGSTATAPDTSVDLWDQVFAVNARGTFLLCKHVIPHMVAAGRGSIVNIASVAGLVGLRNRAAYCASKGAVIALTRALAVDHVHEGIRVNCVCPGTTDSPWVRRLVNGSAESLDQLRARQPMGRLGTPQEIASAALYLASDDAAFVTGSCLVIDGGLTAA